ncbi:halocarboxylic acid dehydrogenase DehI family protein [[Phormidium ambiguum] IAM M-71]
MVFPYYPTAMQLFWQRLKPAMQTESFLADAICYANAQLRLKSTPAS